MASRNRSRQPRTDDQKRPVDPARATPAVDPRPMQADPSAALIVQPGEYRNAHTHDVIVFDAEGNRVHTQKRKTLTITRGEASDPRNGHLRNWVGNGWLLPTQPKAEAAPAG